MRKSRFSEEQILRVLQEQAAGAATGEVCRRHGISEWTFYRWKSKYGGMESSEIARGRAIEDENALAKFIYLKWLLGEDFEDLPDRAWLIGLLEDRARPAVERMAVAIEGVEHQLENEPSDTVA